MLPKTHRQVRLKSRPVGIPQAQHFEIVEASLSEPREREIVVRNEFLSVDPAMRGWVNAVANYSRPVGIGEVMRSYAAGVVAASRHPGFKEGDVVTGQFGWQDYALSDGSTVTRKVRETVLPLSLSLGVLGLNGITAYFGFLDVGEPRPGDTVVVSTAAGSVGSAVGQIAKLMGCVVCGTASVASWDPQPLGPQITRHLLVKRARMQGFVAFDFAHRTEEAVSRLAAGVRAGKLAYREDILDGMEACPGAIAGLYRGENLGKRLIRLAWL